MKRGLLCSCGHLDLACRAREVAHQVVPTQCSLLDYIWLTLPMTKRLTPPPCHSCTIGPGCCATPNPDTFPSKLWLTFWWSAERMRPCGFNKKFKKIWVSSWLSSMSKGLTTRNPDWDVLAKGLTQSLGQSKSAHRTLIMNLAQLLGYWLESRTNLRKTSWGLGQRYLEKTWVLPPPYAGPSGNVLSGQSDSWPIKYFMDSYIFNSSRGMNNLTTPVSFSIIVCLFAAFQDIIRLHDFMAQWALFCWS